MLTDKQNKFVERLLELLKNNSVVTLICDILVKWR